MQNVSGTLTKVEWVTSNKTRLILAQRVIVKLRVIKFETKKSLMDKKSAENTCAPQNIEIALISSKSLFEYDLQPIISTLNKQRMN